MLSNQKVSDNDLIYLTISFIQHMTCERLGTLAGAFFFCRSPRLHGQQDTGLIPVGVPRKLVTLIKTCFDDTRSKVGIGNYLSSSFPIKNGLKQRDALSPLLLNFALEYAIRKVLGSGYELHPLGIGLCV